MPDGTLIVAAINARYLSLVAGAVSAVLLGASYGIALVSGLVEIKRIATYTVLLGGCAVVCRLCLTLVSSGLRRTVF